MSDMLLCPFCGSQNVVGTSNDITSHSMLCLSCGAEGPCDDDADKAASAWNTRVFSGAKNVSSDHSESVGASVLGDSCADGMNAGDDSKTP